MDVLTGLLDGPRARSAFLLRCVLDPPWSMRIQDRAPLCLMAIARGHAWVVPDRADAVRLGTGDVVIIRGQDPYTVADDPARRPQVVIHSGQRCTSLDGEELAYAMKLGVRTWGNSPEGATMALVGSYHLDGEVSQRLLRALPALVMLPAAAWESPLIPLLNDEIVKDGPGQEAVLDRLLDLLLISALRVWFARPEAKTPPWYRAYDDPVVGRALRLLHHNPAHPWTVAELAATTGVSRAALARRFTALVGEPPMTFLAGWRLALSADLLHESDATLGAIARQVGYGSSYALSTAFKRVLGISPQEHRASASLSPVIDE